MTQRVGRGNAGEGSRARAAGWRRKATAAAGAGAVASLLAACGNIAPTSPASGSSKPTDMAAPKAWVINVVDLPKGWHESSPPSGDFRVTVCGVDIEPVLATRAGAWRWSQSGVGPFLAQQVRLYRDDQAHEVIDALKAALPGCTTTQVPRSAGSKEMVTFTIEPISIAGAGSDTIAWRQTLVSDKPVTSEIVLTRRGRTAVLFNSYTIGTRLDRNVLVQAVAALQQTPSS